MAFFGQSLQQKKVGLHGKMLTTTHVTYIIIMYMQNGAFLCKIPKSRDIPFKTTFTSHIVTFVAKKWSKFMENTGQN